MPLNEDYYQYKLGGRGWSSVCRRCKFNRPEAVAKRGYDYDEHLRREAKKGARRALRVLKERRYTNRCD